MSWTPSIKTGTAPTEKNVIRSILILLFKIRKETSLSFIRYKEKIYTYYLLLVSCSYIYYAVSSKCRIINSCYYRLAVLCIEHDPPCFREHIKPSHRFRLSREHLWVLRVVTPPETDNRAKFRSLGCVLVRVSCCNNDFCLWNWIENHYGVGHG